MLRPASRLVSSVLAALLASLAAGGAASASEFTEPWKRPDRALVIDAYEYNSIDWPKLVEDKRIAGFINKASDGLSPAYHCAGEDTEAKLCKALWKRHAVARELFQTRRMVAKSLGLKWGAYHLARPGNPVEQADNFVDFADPAPDDLMAIDIEDNDPNQWMSLEDAETFVRHVRARTGRFPILYTNETTANHIAANGNRYRLLSRLPLWYARYKPDIASHFPKGRWETYVLWQFVAQANCDVRSCPYRPPGTPEDIDVNVASMSVDDLRAAWPFGRLLGGVAEPEAIASVPLPISREAALNGDVRLQFAEVEAPAEAPPFAALFNRAGGRAMRVPLDQPATTLEAPQYLSYGPNVEKTRRVAEAMRVGYTDLIVTRTILRTPTPVPASRFARHDLPVFLLKRPDRVGKYLRNAL